MNVFFHSGDIGDCVAAMPAMRALGGGSVILGLHNSRHPGGMTRQSLKGRGFNVLRPLLEAQPYISSVEWNDAPDGATHDFSSFRHDERIGENLIDWQARHFSVSVDHAPWISVEPDPRFTGRIVMARSPRYHGEGFPWERFAEQAGDSALFVGIESEKAAFEVATGRTIEHARTDDLLQLARVIAGCRLFIGNQSAPFWIAAGLGVPIIQETFHDSPNSIVIRPNARYLMGPDDANGINIQFD